MPTFRDWIAGRTAEGTPADADEFYLRDDSGNVSKRVTYSGLKLALGSVFASAPASTTISAFGATLVDDADAVAARTTLGAAPLASPTFTGDVVVPDADAATEALNRQTGDARYSQPIYIPITDAVLHSGAASVPTSVGGDPASAFDAVAAEYYTLARRIPSWWSTFSVGFRWANAGAGAGDVVLSAVYSWAGAGDNASTGVSATSGSATPTAGAQHIVAETTVVTPITNVADKVFRCRFGRLGTSGSDTLANDINIFGVVLTRIS